MFVDRLAFLYPGSSLPIDGRKSAASGVTLSLPFLCRGAEGRARCRAGPVCAGSWSVFRCAPFPISLVAAHVNLGIAFNFVFCVKMICWLPLWEFSPSRLGVWALYLVWGWGGCGRVGKVGKGKSEGTEYWIFFLSDILSLAFLPLRSVHVELS